MILVFLQCSYKELAFTNFLIGSRAFVRLLQMFLSYSKNSLSHIVGKYSIPFKTIFQDVKQYLLKYLFSFQVF